VVEVNGKDLGLDAIAIVDDDLAVHRFGRSFDCLIQSSSLGALRMFVFGRNG
jgi:hypothetical protein